MNRSIAALALALTTLPLAACDDSRYRVGMTWQSHPYDVWYDGYYGPFYDGYWGLDGFFYFRLDSGHRHYRRGLHRHFHRGDTAPRRDFRRYRGVTREPPRGTRLPSYPPHRDRRDRRHGRDGGDRR